jgi:hypothetical protein
MLYSDNRNTHFAEINGMAAAATGKSRNAVVGPNGALVPTIRPPSSTLSPEYIMGDGNLIPGIGYGWLYTYYDSLNDIESPAGPVGAIVNPLTEGHCTVIKIEGSVAGEYDIVYAEGDLVKEDGYYDNWTIAVNVTNNDYYDDYSEWQYRRVDSYTWEDAEQRGKFVLAKTLYNVDPDEEDQNYEMRLGEVDFEDGEVGGKTGRPDEIVLDANASSDKGDYIMKAIFLVQGVGKGQKRWIIDIDVRTMMVKDEAGNRAEVTRTVAIVDRAFKPKPKFVDEDKEQRKAARAGRFKRKNYKRDARFFNRATSTRYVIVDPLSHSDLVKRGHVDTIEKGNRVRLGGSLSPLGGDDSLEDNIIAKGLVYKFKDKKGDTSDTVYVADMTVLGDMSGFVENEQPDTDEGTSFGGPGDDITSTGSSIIGNRFICEDTGYSAVIKDIRIVENKKNYAEIELEGAGKLHRSMRPRRGHKYIIIDDSPVSVTGAKPPDHSDQYLHGTNAELDATQIAIAKDGDDHYDDELENIEMYNPGKYFIQFGVRQEYESGPRTVINRQIKSAEEYTTVGDSTKYIVLTMYEPLPVDDLGSASDTATPSLDDCWKVDVEYDYRVIEMSLADGYYTGWKIMFYSNDPADATKRGGKRSISSAAATVVAYYDATGEVILDKNVRIGGANISYCLYSEYTRTIGSKLLLYLSDSNGNDAAWRSTARKRFIKLDHFASHTDDYYNEWQVEVMRGWAKRNKKRQSGGNKKNYYTVDDYNGDRQVIDLGSTRTMFPAPTGNEFVHVYDPTSSITAFLDDTVLGDEDLKDEIRRQQHMKATVSGFVPCPLENVDKIKLYRASESTEIYLFEGEKDNDNDDWTSTLPEEELGLPIDLGLANIAPAKHVVNVNNQLVFAGGSDDVMTVAAKKTLPFGISTNGMVLETGVSFAGCAERYSVRKGLPNIAMRLGTITNDDGDGVEQYIKINSDSRLNGQDDVIIRAFMRYKENSADPGSISLVERARKLYRLEVDVAGISGGASATTLTIQQDDNSELSEDDDEYNGMIAELVQGKTSDNTVEQVIHRRVSDYSFSGGTGTITLDEAFTYLDDGAGDAEEFHVVLYKSRWRSYISNDKLNGSGDDLACMTSYGIVTDTVTQESDIEDVDIWFIGLGAGEIQIQYIAAWIGNDASEPLFEYHAGGIVPKSSFTYQEASCSLGDQSDNGISAKIYSDISYGHVRIPAQAGINGTLTGLNGYVDVLIDRPFKSDTGNYTVTDTAGKNTIQIGTSLHPFLTDEQGIVELDGEHDDEITGLFEYKSNVFIFQKNCVWQMTLNPLGLTKVLKGVGCISGNTLSIGRQGIYFVDQNGRPRRWDLQSFPRDLSPKVAMWLRGEGDYPVDTDLYDECCGIFDWKNERYVVAYPLSGQVSSNIKLVLIFDEEHEAWTRYQYVNTFEDYIYSFFKYDTDVGMCGGTGLVKLFDDSAVILGWQYESNWKEGPNPSEKVLVKELIFSMTPTGAGSSVNVKYEKDMEGSYAEDVNGNQISRTFSCGQVSQQVHGGVRGLLWKFFLSGNGAIKLRNLTIKYRPKREAEESWDTSND